jgi:hypothetical protein
MKGVNCMRKQKQSLKEFCEKYPHINTLREPRGKGEPFTHYVAVALTEIEAKILNDLVDLTGESVGKMVRTMIRESCTGDVLLGISETIAEARRIGRENRANELKLEMMKQEYRAKIVAEVKEAYGIKNMNKVRRVFIP